MTGTALQTCILEQRIVKGKHTKQKSKRAKYRSGLERSIARSLHRRGVKFDYETEKIPYTVPAIVKNYIADFILNTKTGKKIYVEGKGIWDAVDRKKHLLIRQQCPDIDIRFVFSNSKNKISKNSSVTYADICNGLGRGEYKGVVWKFADKKIPEEWINE